MPLGSTIPILPPFLPPVGGLRNLTHLSINKISGTCDFLSFEVKVIFLFSVFLASFPKSNCCKTLGFVMGIFFPKGGLVRITSNEPNFSFSFIASLQNSGSVSESALKIPLLPSPTIAMYALEILMRSSSISTPQK